MPDFKDRMADYVPVAERLDHFYKAHPEGSLQSEIVELTENRVTVRAMAYRTPDDPRPGIGHSSLEIPGSTGFTKGSEIENAETSAWGRAIAALGFEVKRGVASREEVMNKQSEPRGPAKAAPIPHGAPAPRTAEENMLLDMILATGISKARQTQLANEVGVPKGQHANAQQLIAILARIETPQPEGSPSSEGTAVATPSGESSPPPPAAALTMDDVLAVTGGEEVPPKPNTPEYRALPSGAERATARAYWDAKVAS